jgi:hypothetical protein
LWLVAHLGRFPTPESGSLNPESLPLRGIPDARIPIIISDAFLMVLFYNISVKKKPLSQTNPYLLDRDERRAALILTTVSSSAIEGIRYSAAEIDASIFESHTPEKLRKRTKSGESRR